MANEIKKEVAVTTPKVVTTPVELKFSKKDYISIKATDKSKNLIKNKLYEVGGETAKNLIQKGFAEFVKTVNKSSK